MADIYNISDLYALKYDAKRQNLTLSEYLHFLKVRNISKEEAITSLKQGLTVEEYVKKREADAIKERHMQSRLEKIVLAVIVTSIISTVYKGESANEAVQPKGFITYDGVRF